MNVLIRRRPRRDWTHQQAHASIPAPGERIIVVLENDFLHFNKNYFFLLSINQVVYSLDWHPKNHVSFLSNVESRRVLNEVKK